jgi:hypothetical protein
MANLYDEKILGTKQKIALAQKLRESGQDMLQGQMIGDRYVAPSWTQHLAQGLQQGLGIYGEMKGEEELKNLETQRLKDVIAAKQGLGIPATQQELEAAGTPAQSPSLWKRAGALLTGEAQPQTTPAVPMQQPPVANFETLPPAQQAMAMSNAAGIIPTEAATLMSLKEHQATRDAAKQKLIEDANLKRELQTERLASQESQKEQDRALRQSLAELVQSNRQAPQAPSWQIHTNADGSVVQIHPQTGEIRPLEGISGKSAKDESGMTDKSQNDLVAISRQKAAVNSALDVLKQQPEAFSFERGAVETLPFGESLIGRANTPAETEARSQVFNIVSSVIKERAGTAQSAGEKRTLERFLPSATDNSQQIESKFKGFNNYLATQEKGIKDYYKPSAPVTANGFTIEKVSD